MLNQRAAKAPDMPIIWDYHVVLLVVSEINYIIDFDTTLPFCNEFSFYFSQSFLDLDLLENEVIPLFKVIPSEIYKTHFSSDRSHMQRGGRWRAPPPDWDCIGGNDSNLSVFIDMNNFQFGDVLTFDALKDRYK